jgi:WD40 repeat protein
MTLLRTILLAVCSALLAPAAALAAPDPAPPPYPPTVTEVPAPTGVRVRHVLPMQTVPLRQIVVGDVPSTLADAVVFTRDYRKRLPANIDGGRIEIEATADGPIYMAASWAYDGGATPAWKQEARSQSQLVDDGWFPLGPLGIWKINEAKVEPFVLFLRDAKAGDKFTVRTRKYNPPVVIGAAAGARLPSLIEWEPEAKLPEETQRDVVGKKFKLLLTARRFADLEKWTDGYLKTAAKFPSGHYRIRSTRRDVLPSPEYEMPLDEAQRYLALLEEWLKAFPRSSAARLAIAMQLVEMTKEFGGGGEDVDEQRRRALELLYEVETADPKIADTYSTGLLLARWAHWSSDLVDDYVERILTHCDWNPLALGEAYRWYADHEDDEKDPKAPAKRITRFLDLVHERTKSKYGDAMYAAVMKDCRWNPIDYPFSGHGVNWSRMRSSFEELEKHFPGSSRNKQLYCLFACVNGDRATASRLFQELGDFQNDLEDVWNSDGELQTRRAWAAPDFTAGDQAALLDYGVKPIFAARWEPDGKHVILADKRGSLAIFEVATGSLEKMGMQIWQPPYLNPGAFAIAPGGDFISMASHYGLISVNLRYVPAGPRPVTPAGAATLAIDRATEVRSFKKDMDERGYHWELNYGGEPVVTAVGVAADRRSFAAADRTRRLRIFDVPEQEMESEPRVEIPVGPEQDIRYLAYTLDGKTLVSVGHGEGLVELRNVEDGKVRQSWSTTKNRLRAAALSPDGTQLVTVDEATVARVWSILDGKLLREFKDDGKSAWAAAFSADGRWLAVGEGTGTRNVEPAAILLYDLTAGQLVRKWRGHKGSVTALDFSPDGKQLLSTSTDMSIRIGDLP